MSRLTNLMVTRFNAAQGKPNTLGDKIEIKLHFLDNRCTNATCALFAIKNNPIFRDKYV